MSNRIFEIISQTKYKIEVSEIENIEDCGDEFLTEEEMDELGISTYGAVQFFTKKIKDELLRLKATVRDGKKSTKITDQVFLEALKDAHNYGSSVSCFLENTRRVGDRVTFVSRKPKVQTKVQVKDWRWLLNTSELLVSERYNVVFKINRNESDKKGSVDLVKKLVTWEELEEYNNNDDDETRSYWFEKLDESDLKWCKDLYENPELIVKEVKEK